MNESDTLSVCIDRDLSLGPFTHSGPLPVTGIQPVGKGQTPC